MNLSPSSFFLEGKRKLFCGKASQLLLLLDSKIYAFMLQQFKPEFGAFSTAFGSLSYAI
jgi:hypothetical protein